MTKQTKEKLIRLIVQINSTEYAFDTSTLIPIFEYVDLLVARERQKILHDIGQVNRKYHYGNTPKKRYDGAVDTWFRTGEFTRQSN
jgi:hypothetical protein